MIQIILMLGSFAWVISELAELAQGGYTTINSTISAIAFFAIAIGIFTLWPLAEKNTVGKAGVGLVSVGMFVFSIVALMAMASGVKSDAEIANTPIFLIAGTATMLGALATGYFLYKSGKFPIWVGGGLMAITVFSLGVAFVPQLTPLQPLANLVLAGLLFWVAFSIRSQSAAAESKQEEPAPKDK